MPLIVALKYQNHTQINLHCYVNVTALSVKTVLTACHTFGIHLFGDFGMSRFTVRGMTAVKMMKRRAGSPGMAMGLARLDRPTGIRPNG